MNEKTKSLYVGVLLTTLGFGLSVLAWRKLKSRKFSHSLKELLNRVVSDKNVIVVSSAEMCKEVSKQLKEQCSQFQALGFDCEWVSVNGKRRPVALLQLASHSGLCALFRLCHLKEIPKELRELLADRNILKVGVSPGDDADYLGERILVRGCLDLRHLAMRHPDWAETLCSSPSLSGLSKHLLDIQLDKDWRIRCSDWEADVLSERQVEYAAMDALVAVQLFKVLTCTLHNQKKRHSPKNLLQSIRNKVCHENISVEQPEWKDVRNLCQGIVDLKYRFKSKANKKILPLGGNSLSVSSSRKSSSSKDGPGSDVRYLRSHTPRQRPLYDNCKLQAPDGQLLTTCDKRKADWYVWKQLGDVVDNDPYTVRLRFEPSARPKAECDLYYLTVKDNCCVVCGSTDSNIRKYVVPLAYRKYFPLLMKNHQSHDVVLLCFPCHQQSNRSDSLLMAELALECGAPLGTELDTKCKLNHDVAVIRSAARALTQKTNQLPEERTKELTDVLCKYFEVEEVSEDVLQKAASLDPTILNPDYIPHGKRVVDLYASGPGLIELEYRWRKHFIDTMKPEHLPPLWSLEHNKDRIAQRVEQNRVSQDELALAVGSSDISG